MNDGLQADEVAAGRPSWLVLGLVCALGAIAYRPLILNPIGAGQPTELELWFFEPDTSTALLAIAVAAWLLWQRRSRLAALPWQTSLALTIPLFALGAALFVWSRLSNADPLLLPSLAALSLAWVSGTKGRAGCRAALLPALVVVLGVSLPAPVRNEVVWHLQLWSAKWAAILMNLASYDLAAGGVLIQGIDRSFTVIESCSGLRGIEILVFISIVVRELVGSSHASQWVVVAIAPGLGFVLNVIRVFVIVAGSTDPSVPALAEGDHTWQGLAVIIAGTGALYGLGIALDRVAGGASPMVRVAAAAATTGSGDDSGERETESSEAVPPRPVRKFRGGMALTCAASLAAASFAIAPFARTIPDIAPVELPLLHARWKGKDLTPDWEFVGYYLSRGQSVFRRYVRKTGAAPLETVDLFIAREAAGNPFSSRLFSSKARMPGPEWTLVDQGKTRVRSLERDVDRALGYRGTDVALIYSWRLRDRGLVRESLWSLFALDAGPFQREQPRAVVRVSTPLSHDGPVVRGRGEKIIDRFLRDFRGPLAVR